MRPIVVLALCLLALPAAALPPPCNSGTVFEDRNDNGWQDRGEPGIPGVKVSDGIGIVITDARGNYRLPVVDGRSSFVIKPAGYRVPVRANGLPDYWRNVQRVAGPELKYGGMKSEFPACRNHALTRVGPRSDAGLKVLLFADPQTSTAIDVGYYGRDIVQSVIDDSAGRRAADLGLSLGDIVNDDLSLYPALNVQTARMGVPWLHVAGNHDLDFDAANDEDSLHTFRDTFGPDTFAWEEREATFIVLDDVIYRPGQTPAYVGGLRAQQFAFLERYLPMVAKDRLLVLAVHIPFFDDAPGRESFRHADRARLFGLLAGFPHVLLLSGHSHSQRHVFHDAASGWHGSTPLHEYNVGAASGSYWSGVMDAAGIPDAMMNDGTPNGYARLSVEAGGAYALSWHPARLDASSPATTAAMNLHAPRVLRRGAYPAWGVYANVFMGRDDTRVEYRIDDGPWQPMQRVEQADPRLLVENMRDDLAGALRGHDRSPEATASMHLWRGALPTHGAVGEHRIQVRAFDPWQGEQTAHTSYRLEEGAR